MQRVVRIQREGEKTRAIVFALEAALALASSFSLPHWNEMDDPFSLFFWDSQTQDYSNYLHP